MNRLLILLLSAFLFISTSFVEAPRGNGYFIRTVVIDAGHGGHDSGCLGSSAKEKHVALAIALKMGKMIEERFPDIKVIYTRKTDVFIPLFERAEIANRSKADLFICIHCNSDGKKKAAFGVETYVMGLHKSDDNLNVAKRENSAILLEDNYKKQYDGFDPNSPEANIIFSLYQNQFINQSLSFASKVQNQIDEYAGRYNRGVKQAGFLVLYKTTMPSVLIETGFLTHNQEEKFLDSEKGQNSIATCIFRAFKEYKLDIEDVADSDTAPVKTTVEKAEPIVVKNDTTKIESKEPVIEVENKNNSGAKNVVKADTANSSAGSSVKANETNTATISIQNKTKPDTVKPNSTVIVKAATVPKAKTNVPENEAKSKVYFSVQIGASNNAAKDLPKYIHIKDVYSVKGADGFVRFLVGKYTLLEDARNRQSDLKKDGFKDAFVAAYNGEQRITVNEAVELLK